MDAVFKVTCMSVVPNNGIVEVVLHVDDDSHTQPEVVFTNLVKDRWRPKPHGRYEVAIRELNAADR